jgi:hypothetical protein
VRGTISLPRTLLVLELADKSLATRRASREDSRWSVKLARENGQRAFLQFALFVQHFQAVRITIKMNSFS